MSFARIPVEMNLNIFITFTFAAMLVSGCATARYLPSTVFANSMVTPVPKSDSAPSESELIQRAGTQPLKSFEGEGWRELFDGNTLAGWRETAFEQGGSVRVTNGLVVLHRGQPFVGVNFTNEIPTVNYEVAFDAMRLDGGDFFCGLTFPVLDSFCSLIVGGWGGGLVGLSNVDGADASENETSKHVSFESGRWYRITLRVTEQKIEAWVEQKKVVNFVTIGRKLAVRFGGIEMSKPFGLASWDTSAAFRAIKIRTVSGPVEAAD